MLNANRQSGFSLMELMIALAIMGILASIAVPQYSKYMVNSRRMDAQVSLRVAAQQLERCRTETFSYTGCVSIATPSGTDPATSNDGHYTLSAPTLTASTYVLKAVPVASGAQAGDSDCASMTLRQDGLEGASSSSGDAASDCWK